MNVTIRDAATLRAIRPAEVAAYLRSHEWKQTETIQDKAIVWTKSADGAEEYEILLLLDPAMSEFARRMAEVMQTLEADEERSQIDILHDIAATTTDVARIRLQHGLIENGSIPLNYAAQMVEQARELMLASACAAIRPRALYAARKPQEAIDYLRGLRMGQTEQGSFVINVQSPVEPRLQQGLFPEDSETFSEAPFERRVTLQLTRALAAAQKAATAASASGRFEPFSAAVTEGVSANLCAAIAALGMDNTAEEVTIEMHWASSRPVAAKIPARFRFAKGTFPLLREAAALLRETAPVEDVFLWGTVIGLRRPEAGEIGQVTVAAWIDNSPRNAQMFLNEADYETAVKAHAGRDIVTVNGDLTKEGRQYFLRNVRDFVISSYPDAVPDEPETPSVAVSPPRQRAA